MASITLEQANKIIEAMKLFIDHGVDVDAFNQSGQTAVHVAAVRGSDEVIRFLAQRGAKLDMRDRLGRTPLDIASGTGGGGGRGGRGGPPAPDEP